MRPLGKIAASLGIVTSIIMVSAPAQARSVVAGHGAARRGPTYPTQHVNEIYVGISKTKLIKNVSDASDIATHHHILVVYLSIQNKNDVIINFDPGWFSVADALQQPVSLIDECNNESSIDAENTRLVQAFYPRLCRQDFAANSGNNINPGASAGGTISFAVPDGQHHVVLTWAPQGAMTGNINWPKKPWTLNY